MYLNVSLDPSTSTITCPTPKTPEILNSLISLTSHTSSQYVCQGSNSDASSPRDKANSFEEYASFACGGCSPLFQETTKPTASSPAYGTTVKPIEFSFGMGDSSIGTPSPPIPELPSPVQPVEATKSALIKSGLKYQIETKLQAAGLISPSNCSDQKTFKEELTIEDEERRRRRRERNKVAATKCRNKKKERTSILVNESEEVEGENLKLKTEIKRLKIEKIELENILKDPNHIACCLRTNRVSLQVTTEAVSLPTVTCSQNVSSIGNNHSTVPRMIEYNRDSAGMGYSSDPSPTPYIYNHTDTYFGTPDNKPSKFSSYPVTCADTPKYASEAEGNDNSFMPLTTLPTMGLKKELILNNKSELPSNINSIVQFNHCVEESQNIMAGNNTIMGKSILESKHLNDPLDYKESLEQECGTFNGKDSTISHSERVEYSDLKQKNSYVTDANEKCIPLKTICPKMDKMSNNSRYFPYDRNILTNGSIAEYVENSISRNIVSSNLCSQNISSSLSTEYKPFYSNCTFEST